MGILDDAVSGVQDAAGGATDVGGDVAGGTVDLGEWAHSGTTGTVDSGLVSDSVENAYEGIDLATAGALPGGSDPLFGLAPSPTETAEGVAGGISSTIEDTVEGSIGGTGDALDEALGIPTAGLSGLSSGLSSNPIVGVAVAGLAVVAALVLFGGSD